jgi:hypothetical protein
MTGAVDKRSIMEAKFVALTEKGLLEYSSD